MAVQFDTPESERANARASDGDFSMAARLAARSAHARLERFDVERKTNRNLAIGDLLYAIYYARRAGNTRTASHLQETLRSYALLLQQDAYTALQEDWPGMTWACLVGLFEEWIGDAYLFTERVTAKRYYDRAEPWYRIEDRRVKRYRTTAGVAPCWQWGAEPEFNKAWHAFREYIAWSELEPPEHDTDYSMYFFDRLDYKRALLAHSGRDNEDCPPD